MRGGYKPALAVLTSDWHLSDKAPLFRSKEKDWLAVQERFLTQISVLAKSLGGVPIVCAGDIFDKWNPSPALINWAMDFVPRCYTVPGQHDLRHHCYEDLHLTAYWTLVKSGRIIHVKPGIPFPAGKDDKGLILHGFPWGFDLRPCIQPPHTFGKHVAIVHKYVWVKGCAYPGAPEDAKLSALRPFLKGYDCAVFGDNHLGFISNREGECAIANTGTPVRRNSDFREYRPFVAILYNNGTVEKHCLDVSADVLLEDKEIVNHIEHGSNLGEFLEQLTGLGDSVVDFAQALRSYSETKNLSSKARELIEQALG